MALAPAEPVRLEDVAELKRPAQLHLKMATLKEVVQEAANSSGLKLRVGMNVSDLKAHVFVREQELGLTLDRLADTLRCEWTKAGDVYTIGMSSAKENSLKSYLKAEDDARLGALRRDIELMLANCNRSHSEIREAYLEASRQMTRLHRDKPAGWEKEVAELEKTIEIHNVLGNPYRYHAARTMKGFTPEQWQRLWSGEVIYASTNAKAGLQRLPMAAIEFMVRGESEKKGLLFMQLEEPSTILVRIDAYVGEGWTTSSSGMSGGYQQPPDHEFRRELASWVTVSRELPLHPDLQVVVAGKPEHVVPSPYRYGYYSDGDHLEWFHRATNLPVVSDAFRVPHRWSKLDRFNKVGAGLYLAEYLKTQPGGFLRIDNGFVLLRRPAFWDLRRSEVPEELIRPLDDKGNSLTMSDYGNFALKLTRKQGRRVISSTQFLSRFDAVPLLEGLPALRLYGALNSLQRGTLVSQGRLPYDSLTAQQRELYLGAVLESIFHSGRLEGAFKEFFDSPWSAGNLSGSELWLQQQNANKMSRSDPPPLDWDLDGPHAQTNADPYETYGFIFGSTPTNGIAYYVKRARLP
jgi:hypothetical protein